MDVKPSREFGFTIIEMLLVIIVVAILAAVAIPQFLDFRTEAKNASTAAAVAVIRTGIATQIGQMIIKCNATPGTYPTVAQVNANNIVTGGVPCTPLMIPNPLNWMFALGRIPENPWSGSAVSAVGKRAVIGCAGIGCLRDGTISCDGATAYDQTIGGWCYNPANGSIWANSNNNGNAAPNGEYSL